MLYYKFDGNRLFSKRGKRKAATVFALLRGFIFLIPAFIIMPGLLNVAGIWLAMPVSEGATALCIGGYYLWKNMPVVKKRGLVQEL